MAIERNKPSPLYAIGSNCGRCGGTGVIPFFNDLTKENDESNCPICGGTGAASYFSHDGGIRHGAASGSRSYADGVANVSTSGRKR